MTATALTDAQVDALRWIDRFPVNSSSWLRNGKAAYRHPDKWNQLRLDGPKGSIIIASDDWMAIYGFLDIVPYPGTPSPWKLNAAGRTALQEAA